MDQPLEQPDLLLTGVPRSGTTLINSLFHSPPEQYMFYERHLSLDIYEMPEFLRSSKWGAKQINIPAVEKFLDNWRPRLVVACVRDLGDCCFSYASRAMSFYKHEARNVLRREVETRVHMVNQMASLMCDAKENGGIWTKEGKVPVDVWIRYEDFVANPEEEKGRIEEVTGWGMGGSPSFYFDRKYNPLPRGNEVKMHGGKITKKAVGRYSDFDTSLLFESTGSSNGQRYKDLFYPEK